MAAKHVRLIDKNVLTCPKCKGNGEVKVKEWTAYGSELAIRTCPLCEGTGEIVAVRDDSLERRR